MLIVIADDHRLMREILIDILRQLEPSASVAFEEAGSFEELEALAAQTRSRDLILLDFHMPGMTGIESVSRIVARFKPTPVLVLSGVMDSSLGRKCIEIGAAGFAPKTMSSASMRNAVRVVLDGEKYIHASTLGEPDSVAIQRQTVDLPRWSTREAEVVALIVAGKRNKEIARELNVSEMTIKTHVRNIYRKLHATSRADAVRILVQGRTP